ncbi:MAG: hypothetical protein JJ895_00635 [Balneolaceae bacterium]|nr:hypothetical protein [Balneolaceae bacterium]
MSKKIDRIEAKKRELEAKLERVQSGLEHNLEHVKQDVTDSMSPAEIVRKNPLPSVGLAIFAGFLLTRLGGSKKTVYKSTTKGTIADSISSSLKKRLSKKAIDMALDIIEDKLASRSSNNTDAK